VRTAEMTQRLFLGKLEDLLKEKEREINELNINLTSYKLSND